MVANKVRWYEGCSTAVLGVGTAWAWTGDAIRVDGPAELLRLDEADGDASIRKCAAKMVRKLVGAALTDD